MMHSHARLALRTVHGTSIMGVHDVLPYFPQYVWHQVLLMALTALHVLMAHGI
jgi:hypothetical protein